MCSTISVAKPSYSTRKAMSTRRLQGQFTREESLAMHSVSRLARSWTNRTLSVCASSETVKLRQGPLQRTLLPISSSLHS